MAKKGGPVDLTRTATQRLPPMPSPPPGPPFFAIAAVYAMSARGGEQVEEDALAHAAIGDAQPADRPQPADRVEDGAAGDHQVGAVAADAGIARPLGAFHRRQRGADAADRGEIEIAAVDQVAVIARQAE